MNNKPILEVDDCGTKYWFKNGIFHREDGPAVEYTDGSKYWYQYGYLHRIDGPAVKMSDGYKLYFLNDVEYLQEEWFNQLTPEQQYNYTWNLDE
jgi:hypothetical protein